MEKGLKLRSDGITTAEEKKDEKRQHKKEEKRGEVGEEKID